MIVPNKAISYEDSLLSKLPAVLKVLGHDSVAVLDLYHRAQRDFKDVNQFLLAMDTLFILDKIKLLDGDLSAC